MTLAEATEAYQVYLEGVRAHPENEQLRQDLERAEREMCALHRLHKYLAYWKAA